MADSASPTLARVAEDTPERVLGRSYPLRTLGLALGALMVGPVLADCGIPHAIVWALVLLYGLAWPHLAHWLSLRSADPIAVDRRCAQVDAALGGAWIALMQFNVLPSALIVTMLAATLIATMLAATLIAIYGRSAFLEGMALLLAVCGLAFIANGLRFAPATGMREMLVALPMLVVFPILLGGITRRLSEHVRAQNRELVRLGSLDSLSGLLNRRHWEDAVSSALAAGCCADAVMLLIDIDRFKWVNDAHGHTVGDEVIRELGAAIRGCLREGDLAGRYGGDEFCVVLRGVDLDRAAAVAERIRAQVAVLLVERVPDLHCTLSIGLARVPAGVRLVREWVRVADAALYSAKLAGRDRLAVAD